MLCDFTLLLCAHSKRTSLIVTRMLHHTQRWAMGSYLDSPGECGPGPAIFQLFPLTGVLTCQSSWRLFSVGVAVFWEPQFVLHMSKVQGGTLTHSIKEIGTISIPTPCLYIPLHVTQSTRTHSLYLTDPGLLLPQLHYPPPPAPVTGHPPTDSLHLRSSQPQ